MIGISFKRLGALCLKPVRNAPIIHSSKVNFFQTSTVTVKDKDDPADLPSNVTLIFELEGMLLNTTDTLSRSMRILLKEEGINAPIERVSDPSIVGESFKEFVQNVFKIQIDTAKVFKTGKFLAQQTKRLEEIFLEMSKADKAITIQPVIHETLQLLAEEGHLMVLCTNLPQTVTNHLLERFGLRRYFAVVVGGDLIPVCKPDPGHLLYAVECSGREISGALMIGSSVLDIKAAKAAAIPIIAIPRDEMMKNAMIRFHPESVIENVTAIPDAMEQLMRNSMY